MAVAFSRFSSLGAGHFRAVCFDQRIAELREEIDQSRHLVQWQCLSAIVTMTVIVYLLVRGLDSLWALAVAAPVIAIGAASLQHALALYRFYVHAHALPCLCEAFGRLRYTVGEAPDLCFRRLVNAGLLPRHDRHSIDDAFYGDYHGHELTLAMIRFWSEDAHGAIDDQAAALVIAVHWPGEAPRLPKDDLSLAVIGQDRLQLTWSEDYLLLAIPCLDTPFDLGGLFEPAERFERRLKQVAAIMQMPHNLIDHLLEETFAGEDETASDRPGESA